MDINQEYDKILKEFSLVEQSSLRQDSKEYQEQLTKCLAHGLNFKTFIQTKSALFSSNETLDDLSTRSLRFLSLDYYLAQMMARKQAVVSRNGGGPGGAGAESGSIPMATNDRNILRLKFLQKVVQLLVQFLISLQDYGILQESLSKKLDKFESTYQPKLNELYASSKDDELKDATLKRQEKIEMYRSNKELEAQIKILESKLRDNGDDDGDNNTDDEETLRTLTLTKLKQLASQSWNQLEQILMEIDLLQNFTASAPQLESNRPENNSQTEDAGKEDPTGYTDKLESLNKPLISKSGKVLRNFTLLDKKDQLKSKVFGYGQYGPTMTVEEFLAKEFEENRVLQGGPEDVEEEPDEDDEEASDRATYKARAWDEFVEANPKGSGNTMNRG